MVRTAYLITGDREEAADVTQEAFARAYERWRSVSRMDRPGAWVTRVAVNLALSSRRRLRLRERPGRSRPSAEPTAPFDPDLMDGLRALTPAQRAVVALRYLMDRSVEDVAHDLGKRPGTVRALTSQALQRLRQRLGREVDDEARR